MSNESFFQNVKVLNYVKIRGGYGEVGNGNTDRSSNNIIFQTGYNYSFNGEILSGLSIPYQVDPYLTWETMKEVGFGVDFKMLDNKLSGTIDIYNRNAVDVILPVTVPAAVSPNQVVLNTGTVSNNGFEFMS
jgi:hypothetical protein